MATVVKPNMCRKKCFRTALPLSKAWRTLVASCLRHLTTQLPPALQQIKNFLCYKLLICGNFFSCASLISAAKVVSCNYQNLVSAVHRSGSVGIRGGDETDGGCQVRSGRQRQAELPGASPPLAVQGPERSHGQYAAAVSQHTVFKVHNPFPHWLR